MTEIINLTGKFGQLSAPYVAESLGIDADDSISHYALKRTFDILVPEFQKDGSSPIAAREQVVDFMFKNLSGRYRLYQHYHPFHFPHHEQDRHEAMMMALIGDYALSKMNPYEIPEGSSDNLVFLAYEIFTQTQQLTTFGMAEGHVLPESLFLASVHGLDALDIIECHLLSYSLDDFEVNINKTLLSLALITDVASPIGQALHRRVSDVADKVDDRLASLPSLSLVR